jgi:hypothetical protein
MLPQIVHLVHKVLNVNVAEDNAIYEMCVKREGGDKL